DRCDHRNFAVVHRGKRGETAAVGTDQRVEPPSALHLLDVDAGVETAPFCPEHHYPRPGVAAQVCDGVPELEPPGDRQCVDGRIVHDDLGHAVVVDGVRDAQGSSKTLI